MGCGLGCRSEKILGLIHGGFRRGVLGCRSEKILCLIYCVFWVPTWGMGGFVAVGWCCHEVWLGKRGKKKKKL